MSQRPFIGHWLAPVERLDLAFFIHRQDQGLVGRIRIKADDILDLGDDLSHRESL